jgi:hypothetical protein
MINFRLPRDLIFEIWKCLEVQELVSMARVPLTTAN